mgnify:CR=1 FL=1
MRYFGRRTKTRGIIASDAEHECVTETFEYLAVESEMTAPIRICLLFLVGSIVLCAGQSEVRAEGRDHFQPITTGVPTGDYKVISLTLSRGLVEKPQTLQLSFRDDRLVNFWFLRQGFERINLLESSLKLRGDSLTGELRLRLCPQTSKREHYGFAIFDFQLSVKDGQVSGSYTATSSPGVPDKYPPIKQQSWNGSASGKFIKGTNSLPVGAAWPTFSGPNGNMSAKDTASLVDDLKQARPVWQSEASVPVSYGNAADSRYFWRAAGAGSGGGACSPVAADGMVVIAFHRPSKHSSPQLDNPYWTRKYPGESDFLADAKATGMLPHEQELLKAHFKPHADDCVVAMDAATGATLWKTVFPMRSYNLQTHKHRGLSGVPLMAEGKVFYPNLHGRLYALDAKTGRVAWEWPSFSAPPETKYRARGPQNPSPLLVGRTLVWMKGKTYGLEPETGKETWVNDFSGYGMQPWQHNGRNYVLANSTKGAVCIDAASGETVWTSDVVLGFSQGYGNQSHSESVVCGDMLVSFRKTGESKSHTYRVSGWRLSLEGMNRVWEDEPLVPDENLSIAISDGVAYCIGKHLVRCLDVKSGKQLGSITEEAFGEENHLRPRSNAWLAIIGDKMLLSPEGQHGKHGFLLYEANPSSLGQLGDYWVPPHATTTAYNGQPIVYPVVDGRIFMRGGDAIYCYDLRRQ